MRAAFVISGGGALKEEEWRQHLVSDLDSLGFSVEHIPEVDLRSASPGDLLRSGTVSYAGYFALVHGRSAHYELPSAGAVGCYLSHLEAVKRVARLPLGTAALVLEGDCALDTAEVDALIRSQEASSPVSTARVIFIGGRSLIGASGPSPRRDLATGGLAPVSPGALVALAHCCLYTVPGARAVLELLGAERISVQFDAALCAANAAAAPSSPPLLWWTSRGAHQRFHISSVQDVCLRCNLRGALPVGSAGCLLLLFFVVGVAIGAHIKR